MKKFAHFCFLLSIISILSLMFWVDYRSSFKIINTSTYTRFNTSNGFNWWSLISPIQTEAQSFVYDTMNFSHRVVYPLGKKFQLINPAQGDKEEKFIASEIQRVIADSLKKIEANYYMDWDKTSRAVREKANPKIYGLKKPEISLSLFGTASPEARKYGLERSITPNKIETENLDLARKRTKRTSELLKAAGLNVTKFDYGELQFSNSDAVMKAIKDPSILDTMRYVQANVSIISQKSKIETATAPVFLPIWLWLTALLFSLFRLLSLSSPSGPTVLVPASYTLHKPIAKSKRRRSIWIVILLIYAWQIRLFIRWIYRVYVYWVDSVYRPTRTWWSARTTCQKVMMFVLPYTIFVTYKWLTCPC